jgi:hypothetical protein
MKFDLYTQFGALNSPPIFESFRLGLLKAKQEIGQPNGQGDVAVIWSVLWNGRMRQNKGIWDRYRNLGKPVIVLEVGNLIRNKTWKIGINGINLGSYFNKQGNDSSRADQLGIHLKDWTNTGQHILICGQHENSQQWSNQPPMNLWVEQTISTLKQHTDRPIVFRPHPRYPVRLRGSVTVNNDAFDRAIQQSWAVVGWNSNPGIQAVINGVPAFVGSASLAAPVANLDLKLIENPNRPERQQWLNDLCWTEWTQEEMEQGIPQKLIASYLQ